MLNEEEIAREEAKFYAEANKHKDLIPISELKGLDIEMSDNQVEIPKPQYRTTHSTGKVKQIKLGADDSNALF